MDAFNATRFCTPPERAAGEAQSWFQYVAFHTWGPQHLEPVSFVNFIGKATPAGRALLCGAACTRRDIYRRVAAADRKLISQAGGLYFALSSFAFAHLFETLAMPAVFGYCGDLQAWNVNHRLGYVRVNGHPHLIVKWMAEVPMVDQVLMIESVKAVGPF